MPANPTVERKGRRELNKEDKVRRIKDAARKLFVANGYDEASTRQIAVRAGVAIGTLFLYAENKRDLLFLVVNDELEDVAERAAAAVRIDASFLENLISAFQLLYEFFGSEPRLARLTLREMMFYEAGGQARRFLKTREKMISLCSDIARAAQDKKELGSQQNHRKIGAVMFAIFQIEIRTWLTSRRVDVDDGLAQLRQSLELIMTGLLPSPQAFRVRNAQTKQSRTKRNPSRSSA
jgi:AcrR family transcriptional regulator